MDVQKVFDTVVHQIQLGKLNHYRICGVLNDWFKSYLSNCSQYVSIDVYESGFAALNCGVPQGSVLGLPADDTDLLRLNNSIKKLNRLVNADLKHLVNWLNANKTSLNVKKTEMVIFNSKQKKFEAYLKIKLCGKRLYATEIVKYLGVKTDINLSWQYHVNALSIKLNRANALLDKMRKYVNLKIFRSIYLCYCCLA